MFTLDQTCFIVTGISEDQLDKCFHNLIWIISQCDLTKDELKKISNLSNKFYFYSDKLTNLKKMVDVRLNDTSFEVTICRCEIYLCLQKIVKDRSVCL